jgi:hypothetical protein
MRTAAAGYALTVVLLSSSVTAAQSASTTTDAKVKADDGKVVTMIGCVEIGGGTSFVLTNITSEQDRHQKNQTPPVGPYALVERKGLDLGPYIQQKVQLTGVIVPAASKGDTQEKIKVTEKTSSESTTVKVPRGATAQFTVATIKTLAPTCQP